MSAARVASGATKARSRCTGMNSERSSFGLALVGLAFGGGIGVEQDLEGDQRALGVERLAGARVQLAEPADDVLRSELQRRRAAGMQEGGTAGDDLRGAWPGRRARRAAPARRPWRRRRRRPRRRSSGGLRRAAWRGRGASAAAAMRWSFSPSPRNTWPTSNSATSPKPRRALRSAAAARPGMRLGRMSDMSAAIGLASFSSGWPPPNSSACRLGDERPRHRLVEAERGERALGGAGALLQQRQHRRGHARRRAAAAPRGRGRGRRCARSARRCRPCRRCPAASWGRSPRRRRRSKPSRARIASPSVCGRSRPSQALHLAIGEVDARASAWRDRRRRSAATARRRRSP